MATARQIITAALRKLGATSANSVPTAEDIDIGLETLNTLIDSKSTTLLNTHITTPYRFQFIPGQYNYELGPTGNWVTERPMRIETAKIIMNPIIIEEPAPPVSTVIFECDFSLLTNGDLTGKSGQVFDENYANAEFGSWPANAPLYAGLPWPEYYYTNLSFLTDQFYVDTGKLYSVIAEAGGGNEPGLFLPVCIPNDVLTTGIRFTARFVTVSPKPATPWYRMLPNLRLFPVSPSGSSFYNGEVYIDGGAWAGNDIINYSDFDYNGDPNSFAIPDVWDGQEHEIIWEVNAAGQVSLTYDGTALGTQVVPWFTVPLNETYVCITNRYLGDNDTIGSFGYTYVRVETI